VDGTHLSYVPALQTREQMYLKVIVRAKLIIAKKGASRRKWSAAGGKPVT